MAHKINSAIKAFEVRVVGEDVEPGIYPTSEALKMASNLGLDLVEISSNTTPPVCKVVDYSKFRYEQKKREKLSKSKSQKVLIKEIRFSPNTDEHDFDFKLKHAKKFLESGAKLKGTLRFNGRELMFKDRGQILLLKFAQALEDYGVVEQMPKLEGRRMTLFIAPKNKK